METVLRTEKIKLNRVESTEFVNPNHNVATFRDSVKYKIQ